MDANWLESFWRTPGTAYERMVLDSRVTMKKAHAIYECFGFQRIPSPPDYAQTLKDDDA